MELARPDDHEGVDGDTSTTLQLSIAQTDLCGEVDITAASTGHDALSLPAPPSSSVNNTATADWTQLAHAPLHVVRIVNASGEELHMLSTADYHQLDGQHVTLLSDQPVVHFGTINDTLSPTIVAPPCHEPPPPPPSSLHEVGVADAPVIPPVPPPPPPPVISVPFVNEQNQHDPEVVHFAGIYKLLATSPVAGGKLKEFSIREGQLYYGTKFPRKVLVDKEEQRHVLLTAHVSPATGVHYGIRRMSRDMHYYWRGVYSDVARTVRQCGTCFEARKLQSSSPQRCSDPRVTAPDTIASEASQARSVHIDVRPATHCQLEPATLPVPAADSLQSATSTATPGETDSESQQQHQQEHATEPALSANCRAQLQLQRATRVWKKVEARIMGPYCCTTAGHQSVAVVADPVSRWMMARAATVSTQLDTLARLLTSAFCQLGVAQCGFVELSEQQVISVHESHKQQLADIQRVVCGGQTSPSDNCFVFSLQDTASSATTWAGEMVDSLARERADTWDTELEMMLLRHHVTPLPQLACTPFYLMFGRNCDGSVAEEDRENSVILEQEKALGDITIPRRQLRSSVLQCRHCGESYTSKISFRIHQRKHTEQARRRGTVDGQAVIGSSLTAASRRHASFERQMVRRAMRMRHGATRPASVVLSRPRPGWNEETLDDGTANSASAVAATQPTTTLSRAHVASSTVAHVQALLAGSRQAGGRRGCYVKYDDRLRHEIAQHAITHGLCAAAEQFSRLLGVRVSLSSVRNFVRQWRRLTPQLRAEIGQYGAQHGAVEAAQRYSNQLQLSLKPGVVRRLIKESRLHGASASSAVDQCVSAPDPVVSCYQPAPPPHPPPPPQQAGAGQYVLLPELVAAESPAADNSSQPADGQAFVYSGAPYNSPLIAYHDDRAAIYAAVSDDTTAVQNMVTSHEPLLCDQQQELPPQQHCVESALFSSAYLPPKQDVDVSQQGGISDVLVPHDVSTSSPSLVASTAPASVLPSISLPQLAQAQPEQQQQLVCKNEQDQVTLSASHHNHHVTNHDQHDDQHDDQDDDQEEDDDDDDDGGQSCRARARRVSSRGRCQRGVYSSYSPELRAEVGRYAYEHGNQAARRYFQIHHGCRLPESTVRGLKKKYEVKLRRSAAVDGQPVVALGFAQRGRPIRLGKYEQLVAECVRQLVAGGEKITSFVCISAARQVLAQYEPQLLEEAGGPIKLNTSWAKSFIKRFGLSYGGNLGQHKTPDK